MDNSLKVGEYLENFEFSEESNNNILDLGINNEIIGLLKSEKDTLNINGKHIEIIGKENSNNLSDLNNIVEGINSNFELLNTYDFSINNKFIRYHNGKILFLPEGSFNIYKSYNINGKVFYNFLDLNKNKKDKYRNTELYTLNDNKFLKINSSGFVREINEKFGYTILVTETDYINENKSSSLILEDNTLQNIPFNWYDKTGNIYDIFGKTVFEGEYGTSPCKMFSYENGEFEEYKFPEGLYRLEKYIEIEGNYIAQFYSNSYDEYMNQYPLFLNGENIKLPENAGDLEYVTNHNDKLLFSFRNINNRSAEYQVGVSYILNDDKTWNEVILHPCDKKYISEVFSFDGLIPVYSFEGGELYANLDNSNKWNIIRGPDHYGKNLKEYKLRNGKNYVVFESDTIYEPIQKDDNVVFEKICGFNNYIDNIEDYNGDMLITFVNKISLIYKDGNIFEFNIDGEILKNFEVVIVGNLKKYKFTKNRGYNINQVGTDIILSEDEFLKLLK